MSIVSTPITGHQSASYIEKDVASVDDLPQLQAITDENNSGENTGTYQSDDDASHSSLKNLSALFESSAPAEADPVTVFTADELGSDLISFSKVSAAQSFLNSDVSTRFFQKVIIDGVTYLQPLKEIKSKDYSINDPSKSKPTYEPIGSLIPYSATVTPTAKQFSTMHSSEQRAFLLLSGAAPDGTYQFSFTDGGARSTYILSADSWIIYNIDNIDKAKFASMSYADQLAISKTPDFDKIKKRLGLDATKEEIQATIDTGLAAINKAFNDKTPTYTVTIPGDPTPPLVLEDRVGFFTKEHLKLFTDQIEIINNGINQNIAVYNKSEIENKLAAIMERFKRALAFGDLPVGTTGSPKVVSEDPSAAVILVGQPGAAPDGGNLGLTAYLNLVSLDKNVTPKNGFDVFIEQERVLLEAEKAIAALIYQHNHPDPDNPLSMDAPQLLYQFQLYRNVVAEAEIACLAEEIRQQNDLITSYSKAQAGLGETMKAKGDTAYLGLGQEGRITKYTEQTTREISMFQTNAGSAGALAPLHPIERLGNITRPRIDAFSASGSANKLTPIAWSQLAAQLKDIVIIIGQDTQDKSHKANSYEKDKKSNSQLAAEVNARANETTLTLARQGF